MASNPLVLVADDEPSMLELVTQHLRNMRDPKIDVVEAADGEEAYRLAQSLLPDLVVLDVMMPGMSGWEVCRKIREDVGRFAHTGVVMLTGIGENLNHMTSPLYGADFYIDKPFDFDELEKKVRQSLRDRAEQRAGVSRPPLNGRGGSTKGKAAAKKESPKAGPTKAAAPAKKATKATPAKALKKTKKVTAKKPVAKKPTPKKAAAKKVIAKKATKPTVARAAKGAKKAAAKKRR